MNVIQLLILFVLPYLILHFKDLPIIKQIGVVVTCYVSGIVIGNLPFWKLNIELSQKSIEFSVPLAIPLLLFGADFKGWLRYAKPAVISFTLACLSVGLGSLLACWLYKNRIERCWELGGMFTGVFIGGTPNMAAIKQALQVSEQRYLIANASDMLLGGIYLTMLMTFVKPLLSKFLKPFEEYASDLKPIESSLPMGMQALLESIGAALLILAISAGITILVTNELQMALLMCLLTVGGVLASWIPRIRGNPMSERVGDYAILIFCISVGSLVDLNGIFSKMSETLAFATVLLFSSIVLHFLFCWIARIDVDTTIITSTACIFSPAFVCPIAEKIGNKKVILTGLTTGVVGLAIGNSMGILLSMLGQWLVTL